MMTTQAGNQTRAASHQQGIWQGLLIGFEAAQEVLDTGTRQGNSFGCCQRDHRGGRAVAFGEEQDLE